MSQPRRSWKHAGRSAASQEVDRITWRRVNAGHYVGTELLLPFAPVTPVVYRIDRRAGGGWSVQVYDGTWAEKPMPENPGNLRATEYIGDEYRTLDDAKAAAQNFDLEAIKAKLATRLPGEVIK